MPEESSYSYEEKTHAAFGGAPIDTGNPRVLAWLIRRHGLEMTHLSRASGICRSGLMRIIFDSSLPLG